MRDRSRPWASIADVAASLAAVAGSVPAGACTNARAAWRAAPAAATLASMTPHALATTRVPRTRPRSPKTRASIPPTWPSSPRAPSLLTAPALDERSPVDRPRRAQGARRAPPAGRSGSGPERRGEHHHCRPTTRSSPAARRPPARGGHNPRPGSATRAYRSRRNRPRCERRRVPPPTPPSGRTGRTGPGPPGAGAPAPRGRPPRWRRARYLSRPAPALFADVAYLMVHVGRRAPEGGLERHPHRHTEERHDEDRDGGRDDAFSCFVAHEATHQPRSGGVLPHPGRNQPVLHRSSFASVRRSPPSRSREEPERLDERDGQEDHSGYERRHGHRHPDLLAPSLHDLDEITLHVAPDGPGFVRDEATEIGRIGVEGDH